MWRYCQSIEEMRLPFGSILLTGLPEIRMEGTQIDLSRSHCEEKSQKEEKEKEKELKSIHYEGT